MAERSDPLDAVEAVESRLRPVLEGQLRAAVESDPAVVEGLLDWSGPGTGSSRDARIRRAVARQATVLTNHVRYRLAADQSPPPSLVETPVTPFRDLPTPADAAAALDELETDLSSEAIDVDSIGVRYAAVLGDGERRARGQFYTPAPVAQALVRWALDGTDRSRVLDPAAGTGTFPLAVLDALRSRLPEAELDALLGDLVAVDVDDVALHVAALRLSAAIDGGPAESFDRHRCSFFDLEPADVGPVDAVVGNPPFVRAGDLLPDRAHFREHLDALGPGGESPYADGDRALSRRSDASVYFLTHATRFLRPGGRLGMVLPAKWLESDYGVDVRRFVADHYDVHAVVGFGARAFDALVDTVLLLAERRERDSAVTDAPVRFVRMDRPMATPDRLTRIAEEDGIASGTRVVSRPQATYATADRCSPYLRAPEALLPLLDHPSFVPLGDLAAVERGVTTGANRFFLLDPADRQRWGIDDRFCRPALRSVRGFDARTLGTKDVEQAILDVHGSLAGRVDDGADDPTARAKAALRDAGHDGLADYVEHAEAEGWHEGRTCQARRVWFDLGELPTPDAFVPKLLRERVFTVRNAAGAVPTNAIDCLAVRDGIDPEVLLGVLDSSLCRALMEVWGRNEAGMLQLMTYETRTLPVPDVRTFSDGAVEAIRAAAADLEPEVVGRGAPGQAALDAAVHDALDLDLGPERVRSLRERLLRRRVDGGDRIEVPVSAD